MPNEPVVTMASIAGLVSAALSFARLMGWLPMTDDQFNQLMIVVGLALPIVGGFIARNQTTPLSDPKVNLDSGRTVSLVREDTKLPTPQAMERMEEKK
jgi:hypothetical protein